MIPVLLPVVLLTGGLTAGVLVGTVLGGMPLLQALPADRYVHAHAFFSARFDPFMPVCLLVTTVGDADLAVIAPSVATHLLFATSGALCGGVVLISLAKNVPVNKWMRTLDPQSLPVDWAAVDPRPRWFRWNRVRTAGAVLALLGNVAASALLL